MRIDERVVGGVMILSMSGRVASRENAVLLKDTINGAVQRGHLHVALDLQRVPYIDSCGIGVIVGGHTIVRLHGGRFLLLNVAECLRDLLRVMQLETVLEIFDSEQEALRSVSPETASRTRHDGEAAVRQRVATQERSPMPAEPSGVPATSDRTQVDDYRDRLQADLKIAARVHRSMIPANERQGDLEIVCDFQPMIGVGGDYASVYFQNDQRVVVGICDVAGHGVASALLAGRVNSFVLNQAPRVCHPCELVDALNEFVFRTFREAELYLTFFALYIDLNKQTIVSAGCGHPPVFHYVKEEDVIRRVESDNPPIGLFESLSRTCSMLQVPFKPGDRLLLYTDGLTESTTPDDHELGVDGLERYFKESAHLSPKQCVDAIIRRVRDFRQDVPASDDQLLLAISYLDPKAPSATNSEPRVSPARRVIAP